MEVVERRSRAMASELHIVLVGGDARLLEVADDEVRRLEARWSRFLPNSDVTRVNNAGGEPVTVDPDTITLFTAMRDAWQITEGRFDATVLPALVLAGYGASIDDPRLMTVLPPAEMSVGRMADIDVDAAHSRITLPTGVAVDPGGIGKGLAADLTVARLIEAGAVGALVSIGGDLAMAGRAPSDDGWVIAVEEPRERGRVACTIAVSGGGVATSSTRSRRWTSGAESRHHIIDPPTGSPSATDLESVTVIDRWGWLAEAHATAALLGGAAGVVGYLDGHGAAGVAFDEFGRSLTTADLASSGLMVGG